MTNLPDDEGLREAVRRFQVGTDDVENDYDWNNFVALISQKIIEARIEATEEQLLPKRIAIFVTQADMAAFLGVSRLTYIKWEHDIFSMPLEKYKQAHLELNRLTALTTKQDTKENL